MPRDVEVFNAVLLRASGATPASCDRSLEAVCLLGGAFRFPDRHQEFGLLSRQFTPAGLPAAFPNLGEILADFARQRDSFGRHWFIVTGL